jgi:hypothetical protein
LNGLGSIAARRDSGRVCGVAGAVKSVLLAVFVSSERPPQWLLHCCGVVGRQGCCLLVGVSACVACGYVLRGWCALASTTLCSGRKVLPGAVLDECACWAGRWSACVPCAMGCMLPLSGFLLAVGWLACGVLVCSTQPVRQSIDGLCTSADPRVLSIRTVPIPNDI